MKKHGVRWTEIDGAGATWCGTKFFQTQEAAKRFVAKLATDIDVISVRQFEA